MKRASYLLVFSLLMLMLTAGCFRIDQELWHNADGTGKASFDVVILDEFLQLASGGQALPHLFETWRGLESAENSNITSVTLDDALEEENRRYTADVELKDFTRLGELQRETLEFRVEEQENGSLRFTQVLDYRLDTSEAGAAETMALLEQQLGDDAYAVRLHVPYPLEADSRAVLDAKAGTVVWTIPMRDLFNATEPVEIWAEYRLNRPVPVWVWIVAAAVLLIGAGLFWFLRWPRTMPGGVERPTTAPAEGRDTLDAEISAEVSDR